MQDTSSLQREPVAKMGSALTGLADPSTHSLNARDPHRLERVLWGLQASPVMRKSLPQPPSLPHRPRRQPTAQGEAHPQLGA